MRRRGFGRSLGVLVLIAILVSGTTVFAEGESGIGSVSGGDAVSGGAAVSGNDAVSGGDIIVPESEVVPPDANQIQNIVENVNENLDQVLDDEGSVEEKVADLKENLEIRELATAIENDDKIIDKLVNIEEEFKAEKNITVTENVDAALGNKVAPEKVSVVGAALNVESGSLELVMKKPAKQEKIDKKIYKNSFQVDIKLMAGEQEIKKLDVPVTIFMEIPMGLDESKLVLLHFNDDGSYQKVKLKFLGKRRICFTVTHFSNFVFAEEEKAGETPLITIKSVGTSASVNSSTASPGKAPKTDGESAFGWYVTMAVLLATAFVLRRIEVLSKRRCIKQTPKD